jgi:hypothetical protein
MEEPGKQCTVVLNEEWFIRDLPAMRTRLMRYPQGGVVYQEHTLIEDSTPGIPKLRSNVEKRPTHNVD